MLYEYDSFGNQVKQTLALSATPTKDNSPIAEIAYSAESAEDGVYSVTTQTRYNAEGEPLRATQKQLISQLSHTLENKSVFVSERDLTSFSWSEYSDNTKRTQYSLVPTSNITAEAVTVDGFAISQKDTAGIVTTAARSYTANGMQLTQTDGRGNTTTTISDIAGRTTSVTDAAGVRTITYNQYGEQEGDSLEVDNDTHLITEMRDALGHSTGYVYSKNGTTQQTVSTGYGADGRINSAGFLHGGEAKNFGYTYLAGTNLLQVLTKPNGMTLTQSYEPQRDLLTGMSYHRGSTLVAQRSYTYDTLGRPLCRSTARNGQTVNDRFGYNNRSELTTATVNNSSYAYNYDNIGNRKAAQEVTEELTSYTSNELNQYSAEGDFIPEFDIDGNQTRVKTSTGIWGVIYNAENRPTDFYRIDETGSTTVKCTYDHMGRRATKLVTENGNVTLHQRYIYRGYLQIACIDLTRSHHPALWYITWDPTQPVATRPLAIQKDGTWYTYGWDLTKNICEVYGSTGYIRTNYSYSPYGDVTISGDVSQPIQWSSEYSDSGIGLVYYNYRHYNSQDGRWITRDLFSEEGSLNLHNITENSPVVASDTLGLWINIDRNKHLWCAEKGDSLQALPSKVSPPASSGDWVCLRPAKGTKNHGYPDVIWPGDVYDASNLKLDHKPNRIYYTIDDSFKNDGSVYNVNYETVPGYLVASRLLRQSKGGTTPITELIVDGHGNKTINYIIGTVNGIESSFSVNHVLSHASYSFEDAKQGSGHFRCWFARNATVRFSACYSKRIALLFSQHIMRKGSTTWGTRHTIAAVQSIWGGPRYLKVYNDRDEVIETTGRGAGIHAKTWIGFPGTL